MMKLILAITVLFCFQTQAHAQSAAELLNRDIMSSAKVLKSDTKIYNYYNMEKVWPELESESGRKAFVRRYLAQRAGSFWDMGFTDASPSLYAAGAALYFAIDPHISQTFGNFFIELTLPAGTRFINVVAPIPLKKDTQAALIAENLVTREQFADLFPKQTGFYRDTLRAMVKPQYAAFRKTVQRIFTQNQIQFVEYNFNTSLSGFCRKHSYSAFAYVGLENPSKPKEAIVAASFSNVSTFSAKLSIPHLSPSETAQQEDILKFRNVLENIISMRKQGQKNIKDYILREYSAEEYQRIQTRTFSCEN